MEQTASTVDDLQKRFETLTPAPRISTSLKALVAEGNINPDEIIALIRLEPLLATRILREANQGPYAKDCSSIEQAATAVGFERMYDLLGIYSYQYANELEQSPSYSPEAWKRAVTCAVCMESLAAKHRLDPHEAYSIGLLHSLTCAINEAYLHASSEGRSNGELFSRLNARLKSYGNSGLTYTLFRDWGFPDNFTDPIRFQYSPLDCLTTGKMACLLNLSKWITGVIREHDELPDQDMGPDLLVLNLLGEGEQTLWNLVTEVSDSLQKADVLLQGKLRTV